MKFKVKPHNQTAIKAAITEVGKLSAVIKVERHEFKNAYTTKYKSQVELNGYLAYDAFKLLEAAVTKAGVADSKKIAETLSTTEVQGITGYIKIDPTTHNPEGKDAAILKIVDDKYVFQMKYSLEK